MNRIKSILLGASASVLLSSAALAADFEPVVPPPPVVVVPAAVPAFDWAGPYVGTRAELMLCSGICWLNLDAHAGFNFVAGRFLAGVELGAGGYLLDGEGYMLRATARAGLVLGRALAYGKAGVIVYNPGSPSYYATVGGGIELGIGQSLSVFAGVTVQRRIGGGDIAPGFEVGVNFHFGN